MRYLFALMCVCALGVTPMIGCGEGSVSETVDVAGRWQVSTEDVMGTCGGVPRTFEATITQDGNALTVEFPGGAVTGTIDGNRIHVSGSFPEDGGTVSLSLKLTVSGGGDSMQGSDEWTWKDGFDECWGSESVSAVRI